MILRLNNREDLWWFLRESVNEIFKISLISYLLFYLIDDFKNGFISNYFNLNILLITVIITGVLTVLLKSEKEERENNKIRRRDYIFIIILGVITAGIIYYRIKEIGKLSFAIAIISGVIIILLSILFIGESSNKEEND